ncbi:MAG: hypothetical protein BWY74_01325 [Firmicutes bacterium ADurb.Bin419]|nr:MAG: hypothetical protein BWY74_01325 [Firmicutes bacterium ADurb.Bin419]
MIELRFEEGIQHENFCQILDKLYLDCTKIQIDYWQSENKANLVKKIASTYEDEMREELISYVIDKGNLNYYEFKKICNQFFCFFWRNDKRTFLFYEHYGKEIVILLTEDRCKEISQYIDLEKVRFNRF